MPVWESIVAQKEWICRVQWLALRSWCFQFICLGRVYYGPDIVWFNGTPPISKLSAGAVILGCIFWQSRDDQEIYCKAVLRSELELSCSSTLEISITPWAHEHFTSQLTRFLGSRDPLFRLSPADISQAISGKPQVLLGNKDAGDPQRPHRPCQIPLKNMKDLIQHTRLLSLYAFAKSAWFYSYHWEFGEWQHWKYCQVFNCVHFNILSSAMQNSQESAIL